MIREYSGDEHFTNGDMPTTFILSDFYSWLSAEMTTPAVRNLLAEYIVATALGVEKEGKSYPCLYYGGYSVSISSSGYVQTSAGHLVSPTFKAPAKADISIFCLHEHLNKDTSDLMKLEQWTFFITDKKIPDDKPLTVSVVKALSPYMVKYDEIKGVIDSL